MNINYLYPEFEIKRDDARCTRCRLCERQCAFGAHGYDVKNKLMTADSSKCVACQRCVSVCPTRAIKIVKSANAYKDNANFTHSEIENICRQAQSGAMLLSSMGFPGALPVYWDKMLINASQVTNPSIDPLREPMETRTFLGKKDVCIERDERGNIKPNLPPRITLETPIMFSAMSFGSISYNAHLSLARAARELGICYNCGEGGLHEDFYAYGENTIVQVASGRFGVHKGYLEAGAAIEIKIGQGAKPGIGGHLPGSKMTGDVSRARMVPEGSDAISPAPHHDIYSIEDLRQLVVSLKEATGYKKPVIVKIAAVHNAAEIASGIARSGADIIAIDGFRGGTGAAPLRIRDNVGIPIELALAAVDERLREEGIRESVSLIAGGSIRNSADAVKAIALGADAVYIGTAALIALGCRLCRSCHTGLCSWGMGKGAEHYIRTGRARQITREEVYEIIKRAEDNGLMHDMPNIEEAGESSAICNCCSCACFGLRVGLMYGARDGIRSNFVAEIDEEKCVACGQCVESCPANALKLGQKIASKTPLKEAKYRKMSNSLWKESDWNVGYRENREDVVSSGTSPCKAACPAHIAVQGYLRLAAEGRYTDALALIKKENPFPAVCGRICNHKCETECTRGSVDKAVAIDEVKRFIADHDLSAATKYVPPMINQIGRPYDEKIAIIGAGPAGMTCAFFLAQKGYKPTVFDKAARPGGMLMNGIPSFRLEKDVVEAEIEILREMGVEFKCGVEVGKDITIQQLRDEGYKGFYIAIGAQGGRAVGVPGEDAEGVLAGVSFLHDVNVGNSVRLNGKTVVIGGGNVAVDVARTAARVGSDSVSMYCLESRDIMPAAADEVEEAEKEGITVNNSWGPKEIVAENGKVKAVVFKKCVSVFNDEKKFDPKYDENDTITVECDNVLLSIGQSVVWGDLLAGTKVELNRNGTVKADELTYQTAEPDIFAGGDVYTGPKFAIDAIAAGKEAAISLHRWVHPGQTLTMGRDRRHYIALNKENLSFDENSFDNTARQEPGYNAAKAKTFGDTRVTFTEEQVRKETARCLGCGATKVDEYMCIGCGLCTTKCEFDAIKLKKVREWQAGSFETMPIKAVAHVVKKVGKVIAKPFSE